MRIACVAAAAILLLLGAAGGQETYSANDVRALAARVERLEQRLAQLEASRPPAGGMFRIVTENVNRAGLEALLKGALLRLHHLRSARPLQRRGALVR